MERPERRFWIELSYRYCIPVRRLQREISSREFAELMAEERLEPRGVARTELQFARLMALIANCVRDRKQKPSPFKPEDFYSKFIAEEQVPLTEEQSKLWAQAFVAAFGGKVHGDNRQYQPDAKSVRGRVPVQHGQGD